MKADMNGSIWNQVILSALYTITPTHCGVGQTTGAIDLPIAKESTTGIPVFPATSIKGVARDTCQLKNIEKSLISRLFGKDLENTEESNSRKAGELAFTEARLILFPVRSLNRPFLYVTSPLILERLERDARLFGVDGIFPLNWKNSDLRPGEAQVSDPSLAEQAVVLEDLIYEESKVAARKDIELLAENFSQLIPEEEIATRERIKKGLIVIPDEDFLELIRRSLPVLARIRLSSQKTSENLWYEEYLPSDCLLLSFVGERRQSHFYSHSDKYSNDMEKPALNSFIEKKDLLCVIQIGGNETVGNGICFWTFKTDEKGAKT